MSTTFPLETKVKNNMLIYFCNWRLNSSVYIPPFIFYFLKFCFCWAGKGAAKQSRKDKCFLPQILGSLLDSRFSTLRPKVKTFSYKCHENSSSSCCPREGSPRLGQKEESLHPSSREVKECKFKLKEEDVEISVTSS